METNYIIKYYRRRKAQEEVIIRNEFARKLGLKIRWKVKDER